MMVDRRPDARMISSDREERPGNPKIHAGNGPVPLNRDGPTRLCRIALYTPPSIATLPENQIFYYCLITRLMRIYYQLIVEGNLASAH